MADSVRKSGLELIGDVPWGTHFCQFYQTKDDLTDILVPYFAAGLENNEFCMWITSDPLTTKDARAAMERAVSDFAHYEKKGQIEILPYSSWYLRDGEFDADRVLRGWVEKHDAALERGFAGLRLSGNTFWLEQRHWKEFTAYEEAVNKVIGNYRMLGLCTYSLDKCGASEIMDVVANHQFALVKRAGGWETVVSSEGKRAEVAIRESERRYRSLFDALTEGFALHEIVCDEAGAPCDYRFLDVNPAFERLTGLKRENVLGRTVREILPGLEPSWIERYGKVALTGEPIHFDERTATLDRHYEVFAYSPAPRQFATLFVDVSERKKMEKELTRLASFPHLNPNPVIELDSTGRIFYANPASIARFPELREAKTCSPGLEPLLAGAKRAVGGDRDVLVREQGINGAWYQIVYACNRADGHVRVYLVDITGRKNAEQALSDREQRLRQASELLETVTTATEVIIATVDTELRFTFFNEAYQEEMRRLTGRDVRIGMSAAELFTHMPEQQRIAVEMWRSSLEGQSSNFTIELGDPGRYRRMYSVRHTPIRDLSGTIAGAGEVAYDVTEQMRSEEARRASEMRLARSQEIAHLGSWELDLATNEITWSDEVYRIFGMRPQELPVTYSMFLQAVHPDDRAAVDSAYTGSLRAGRDSYEIEHRIVRPSTGEVRIVHEKCDHLRDESGRIVRSIGIVHDITERTAAEERIRRQNAILEGINRIFHEALAARTEEELGRLCLSVAEAVTGSKFGFLGEINKETGRLDDIAISDPGWRVCCAQDKSGHGRAAARGFRIQGIYGRVLADGRSFYTNDPSAHPDSIGTPEGHPALTAFIGVPLLQDGVTFGMIALGNREGGYRDEDLDALEALAGPIVQALMRRRVQQALHESEATFRSLADNAPSVIMRFDRNLRAFYVSPRGSELTGVSAAEFTGKTIRGANMPEKLASLLEEAIQDVFQTARNREFEIDLPTDEGTRTFIVRFVPEGDSPSGVVSVLGVGTDVTSIKRAAEVLERDKEELKRLVEEKTQALLATQVEIDKAKRLSDIGTLAATVAHELRNPLGAMNLAVFNLRRKTGDPALQSHFNTLEKKIAESGQIIDNLLFYARLKPPTYRSVVLSDLIEDALATTSGRAREKEYRIVRKIDGATNLSIDVDPLQIKELLMNIVDNAADAVADAGGVIEIGAARVGNNTVLLSVTDNGKGIESEHLPRIWEPFFTTKSRGTGLGLSLCRQIVGLHNGTIDIESESGSGTTVTVTLPIRKSS